MQYRLTAPASLHASVQLPASKSISNRALILHALSGGAIRPENLSDCDDTQVMIRALDHMPDVIDIHAAGTATQQAITYHNRSEERRVGKECRSRWSPYH